MGFDSGNIFARVTWFWPKPRSYMKACIVAMAMMSLHSYVKQLCDFQQLWNMHDVILVVEKDRLEKFALWVQKRR